MQWLMIENDGEVPREAFTLFGASTKRGDKAKIGFFGTGNKYALARLLREGAEITVCAGQIPYEFKTSEVTLKDKTFQQMVLVCGENRQELGITTDLGPTWEPWMAVRELVCNAIDEGEYKAEVVDKIKMKAGKTRLFISFPTVREVWNERGKFFRMGEKPAHVCGIGRVLHSKGPGTRVYRKGILVREMKENGLYDYDLDNIDIAEDRSAGEWDVRYQVFRLIDDGPIELKQAVLKNMADFEKTLAGDWMWLSQTKWQEAAKDLLVVSDMQFDTLKIEAPQMMKNAAVLSNTWYGLFRKHKVIEEADPTLELASKGVRELEPTEQEVRALDRACAFINGAGMFIVRKDVVVVEGETMVAAERLCVSRKLFEGGFRGVVERMLCERVKDQQRDNAEGWLVKKVIDMVAEKRAEVV